jgi:hypothetical protein
MSGKRRSATLVMSSDCGVAGSPCGAKRRNSAGILPSRHARIGRIFRGLDFAADYNAFVANWETGVTRSVPIFRLSGTPREMNGLLPTGREGIR